jgi:hypothetical protein
MVERAVVPVVFLTVRKAFRCVHACFVLPAWNEETGDAGKTKREGWKSGPVTSLMKRIWISRV